MTLRVAVALACLTGLAEICAGSLAHAQMSEGERKAAARAAYTEGAELQEKGKPTEALSRFEAAEKLFDAPTHLLRIAQCQTVTGKLVEASETYETLVRKTLAPGSPDAFVQAQEQGKTELTTLRARIPTMRVMIHPEPQTLQNLQIILNDKQMPIELVGITRPVNPGNYRISAAANGWATPTPLIIDVAERETKQVELTLQQGATSAVVAPVNPVTPPTPVNAATPPPAMTPPLYDTKPAPKDGPSPSGLLIGARAGVYVPGGDVDKTVKFDNYATAGPGLGIDLIGRVAKMFLIGGTVEVASLGAPDGKAFAQGKRAEVKTRTLYFGVLAGIMPNVDKVTFVADAGVGYRVLDRSLTLTDSASNAVSQPKTDTTYTGLELAIAAGVSIPAGPLRIVPKAGLSFGQFSTRSCNQSGMTGALATTITGCSGSSTVNESSHSMFNVVVGFYYNADFSKKPAAAPSAPTSQTTSSL